MKNIKTAFVTFFPVKPNNMGSSTVINSRFKYWPGEKKIFQLSTKNINSKFVITILLKKENPINKILSLPSIIFKIFKFLNNHKNNFIVIEGASWIFYSFIILIFFKVLLPKTKLIYFSHSIESEIRKKYSNKFIYLLTFYLEKFVLKYSDIATSVSNIERKKFKKIYNKETVLFPNAISVETKIGKKNVKNKYIIYCGSYHYHPNKVAIDYLNKIYMPKISKKFPNIKLILTGGGYNKKFPWLINKGIVEKKMLYNLIYFSEFMCVPLNFGSGTRIKILEALSLGTIVLSSKKGIEGIDLHNIKPPFMFKNEKELFNISKKIILNNRKIKLKSKKNKTYFINKYSMKKNLRIFLNDFLY